MNVTLKLPNDLIREARHRAVNQSQSLSAWLTSLVRRELADASAIEGKNPRTWIEAFSGDAEGEFSDCDFPLEDRKSIPNREFHFEDEA